MVDSYRTVCTVYKLFLSFIFLNFSTYVGDNELKQFSGYLNISLLENYNYTVSQSIKVQKMKLNPSFNLASNCNSLYSSNAFLFRGKQGVSVLVTVGYSYSEMHCHLETIPFSLITRGKC